MECPFNMEPSLKCVEERCCFECRYAEFMGDQFPCNQCRAICGETNYDGFKGRCMYTKES